MWALQIVSALQLLLSLPCSLCYFKLLIPLVWPGRIYLSRSCTCSYISKNFALAVFIVCDCAYVHVVLSTVHRISFTENLGEYFLMRLCGKVQV
uniref:Uncharacterized protein n=1 Tax=Amblyomma triste TaxID=251400 RepID=A0A023G084_AMBTT